VLERLVEMFKKSDTKGYIRQPVVSYLTVASEQPGDVGARAKTGLAELEKLDPETVKTARSLMAFGALGRARGAASAASATAKTNTTATTPATEPSTSSYVDSANAFSASAADDKTDTSHIPDPATFNQEPQGKTAAAKPQSSTTPEMTPAVANASGTSVTKSQSELHKNNPLLVAGLPLAAAVALMGIYWLILRAGAV
jgi:hypothetical protein